ncbi:B- and T-lymphocyte attenuator [Betta splendens]|uniref:B- and T-lymphocyte attenuator n=1 Tax=Betta splendens TaxID=158456 RepID=A0A6P7LGH5_BETSP|nr:B- and T-lymphocyte attenuator [Betta splendens]
MMRLTRKLQYTCLMMLCWTLRSIHGEAEAWSPSCEADLKVPRGTAWKTAPQRPLTLQCPVKHCGERLNVTWCKLSINQCDAVTGTETVEIMQFYQGHLLISNLTFKVISISDDGLYRCYLEGRRRDVSHSINVSVSDMNQGAEYYHSQPFAARRLRPPARDVPWLPYFIICFSVAFLAFTMTALSRLSSRVWRRTLNCSSSSHEQVTSRCTIPGLPQRADPSIPVLQAHFPVLNHLDRPRSSGPTAPPPPPPGAQSRADEGDAPASGVYAVIKHKQRGTGDTRPQTQSHRPEYSTVSVS